MQGGDGRQLQEQYRCNDNYKREETNDQTLAPEHARIVVANLQEGSTPSTLFARLLAQPVIGLDQASWGRLDGKKDTPWQMWALTAPGMVVHRIRDDKGADTFKSLIGNYRGIIVCDALKPHEAGARGNDAIARAGCRAHVYRKFEEAAPNHPQANIALNWIGDLYEIDERAAGDVDNNSELRRTDSDAVTAELKTWSWSQLATQYAAALPIDRVLSEAWLRLTRFLQDVRIPFDNNATERAIRGPVVGCRNHYGSKSERGTQVASVFYSLLETAKLAGVGPATYLREAALADARGEALLPADLPR